MTRRSLATIACLALAWRRPDLASAQTVTQRGFVEARAFLFPQDARNDQRNVVGDFLLREEAFAKPTRWLQFAAGLDARANTYGQVERLWRFDIRDRRPLRPAFSIRRLSATMTRGPLTVDVGKQFIRWGKTDIVTPTDRVAPRDFLNVVDSEFLAVSGVRSVLQVGAETFEGVWVPFLTPSRTPLLDQRWTSLPPTAGPLGLVEAGVAPPRGSQAGIRWAHAGRGYEYALSYFDGFNHLPNIGTRPGSMPGKLEVVKKYPSLRSYGVDAAVPTRWFTIKGESTYFTSSTPDADEYVLYVVQLERQTGEWLLIGGYAGQIVTERRTQLMFAPDRGLTQSLIARASYTIDANRSFALETAIRQTGRGAYAKAEYSQARGTHWRITGTASVITGHSDDFLGQYRENSHLTLLLRYSF